MKLIYLLPEICKALGLDYNKVSDVQLCATHGDVDNPAEFRIETNLQIHIDIEGGEE
jgi:hypothetical protein